MIAFWEKGWQCVFAAIEPLKKEDLMRHGKDSRPGAYRAAGDQSPISHYSNHIGQIVYLAKHFKSGEWQTLSVPT